MSSTNSKLSELNPGNQGKISHIAEGFSSIRLMEMGLTPGTKVTVTARSPMGDPIAVHAGDFNISLRKSDARLVVLESV